MVVVTNRVGTNISRARVRISKVRDESSLLGCYRVSAGKKGHGILDQSWRNFVRARAQIVCKIRRNPFACPWEF